VVYAEEYRSSQGLLNLAIAGVETKRVAYVDDVA
jgi:hypothetical protein